jgi:hypothetical protein
MIRKSATYLKFLTILFFLSYVFMFTVSFLGYTAVADASSGIGDNLWNIKWFGCDYGHDNVFILQRDGTPVCGSGNCPGSPGSCWGATYTQDTYPGPSVSWTIENTASLTLSHAKDVQVYGDIYLFSLYQKSINVPWSADVGRIWLNDVDITSDNGVMNLQSGWNHLEFTSYNQNQDTNFIFSYDFTNNVFIINSSMLPVEGPLPISYGQTLSGNLSAVDEMDVYTFTASANDRVRVRMGFTTDGPDPEIRLYGPDGNVLTGCEDYSINGGITHGSAEISSCTLPSNGVYTIIVSEYGGDEIGGDYTLYLECLEGSCDITQYQLTTSTDPSEGGTITPDCSSGCWYDKGTIVTINATANSGYKFSGWSGACSSTGVCQITMDSDKNVTANFCGLNTYYKDADGDGYGEPNTTIQDCTPPPGYVAYDNDCNDNNASINPGISEVCDDGVDNDCDNAIDNNDTDCSTVTTLATGLYEPGQIAVDTNYLYVSEVMCETSDLGKISKVPLDGGSRIVLASGLPYPLGIAVDDAYIYFSKNSMESGAISRIPLNGGAIEDLATGLLAPRSIARDNAYIYWAEDNGSGGSLIKKVSLNGGSATTLASSPGDVMMVAVDTDSVYWPDITEGSINRVSKDGGSVETLVSGLNNPWVVVVDNNYFYWTEYGTGNNDGAIKKMPKNGGTITTIVSDLNFPLGLAVDDFYLYWTEGFVMDTTTPQTGGAVKAVPVSGGAVTTVAQGLNNPAFITMDENYIYWTEGLYFGPNLSDAGCAFMPPPDGTIKRASKLAKPQVTATRDLPAYAAPDTDIDVIISIDVDEANAPNGLIVKEHIPDGWEIISATPAPDNCTPGDVNNPCVGEIKWLFYGSSVVDTTITYSVHVPATEALGTVRSFSGELNYNDPENNPVVSPIGGDSEITIGCGCDVYDKDCDWKIGDFELLDKIDDWAKGLIGDFELLDNIDYWAYGSYCWYIDIETGSCNYSPGVYDENSGQCLNNP